MVLIGDLDLTQFWLLAALALYAVAVGLGLFVYTPILRNQIVALERAGAASTEFQALSRRSITVGIVLAVDVIVIVFLHGHQADALIDAAGCWPPRCANGHE